VSTFAEGRAANLASVCAAPRCRGGSMYGFVILIPKKFVVTKGPFCIVPLRKAPSWEGSSVKAPRGVWSITIAMKTVAYLTQPDSVGRLLRLRAARWRTVETNRE